MSIWSFLFRLCLSCLALSLGLTAALGYLGISGSTWAQAGVVLAMTYVLCMQFGEVNRRYFSRREKITAVAGFMTFDLLLQIVRASIALGALARSNGGIVAVTWGQLLFPIVLALSLHLIAVLFTLNFVEERLIKSGVVGG